MTIFVLNSVKGETFIRKNYNQGRQTWKELHRWRKAHWRNPSHYKKTWNKWHLSGSWIAKQRERLMQEYETNHTAFALQFLRSIAQSCPLSFPLSSIYRIPYKASPFPCGCCILDIADTIHFSAKKMYRSPVNILINLLHRLCWAGAQRNRYTSIVSWRTRSVNRTLTPSCATILRLYPHFQFTEL